VRIPTRLALVVTLFLSACGSSSPSGSPVGSTPPATVAPTSTAAASARPSGTDQSPGPIVDPTLEPYPSTETDVPAAFVAALGSSARLQATIAGTVTTPAGATPVSGEYQQAGHDYHLVLVVGKTGAARRTELSLVLGQRTILSRGLFMRSDPAAGTTTLAAYLDDLALLHDLGDTTEPFGAARHLAAPANAAALDFTSSIATEAAKATSTVDLYAAPDGTPLGVVTTSAWKGATGASTAELRFTITAFGGAAAIEAPAVVYSPFHDKRYHMTVAVPVGWDLDLSKDSHHFDQLIGTEDEYLQVFSSRIAGGSLNEWTSIYLKQFKSHLKSVKVLSNVTSKVAGVRARRVTLTGTYKGDPLVETFVVVLRGTHYYVVLLDIYDSDPAHLKQVFDPIVNSLQFA
jgi:hypothetical protein